MIHISNKFYRTIFSCSEIMVRTSITAIWPFDPIAVTLVLVVWNCVWYRSEVMVWTNMHDGQAKQRLHVYSPKFFSGSI